MLSPPSRNCVRASAIPLFLLVTALAILVHRPLAAAEPEKPAAAPAGPASRPDTPRTTPRAATDAPAPDKARAAVDYDQRTVREALPRPVAEMIDAIQAAVASGRIEELATALEWNELPPALAPERIEDPIAFLKGRSHDGAGAQMLAILGDLMSVGPARQPLGRDLENNIVYVWPYLAELPLDKLKPSEQVDLYRLVPAEVIAEMRKSGRWTWYRVVIGADGTWHAFMRHD